MAFPAGNVYSWNGVIVRTRMPASGETVNGQPFAVHVPALTGSGATLKFQTLSPTETVEATQVWQDVYFADLSTMVTATNIPVILDQMLESTSVTVPVSATGGGVLRLVASEDQSSAVVTVPIYFAFDD
jgi:hypothetical protein